MKLSEAIREGAKFHPQGFGVSLTFESGKIVATCAIGAACVASSRLNLFWSTPPNHITDEIARLNDDERQSREQIADWVEQQGY